jgi:hypothetical protein
MSVPETKETNMKQDVESDVRNKDDASDASMPEADGGLNGWMTVAGV